MLLDSRSSTFIRVIWGLFQNEVQRMDQTPNSGPESKGNVTDRTLAPNFPRHLLLITQQATAT